MTDNIMKGTEEVSILSRSSSVDCPGLLITGPDVVKIDRFTALS